jgi:hypothetical protein
MKKIANFPLVLVCLLIIELSFAQEQPHSVGSVFIPDFVIANFAGHKGKYAFGAGYCLNPTQSLQLGILYGFTPKSDLPDFTSTFTARGIFNPKVYPLGSGFAISPQMSIDISYSTAINKNTWLTLPQHYPRNYYSTTAIRFHLGVGGKVSFDTGANNLFKKIDFYAEATTNDLYVKYILRYRELAVPDIFNLGMGIHLWF